ncbi:transposase [Kocuria sp.]|uniref:transposase n=1 Tax=Kocuria sp. TaxID=1871328 RepID=UPI0026DF1350|nr:transposase [Kocuria sp.]MDO5617948.1 transposase [Kocuria sp.]
MTINPAIKARTLRLLCEQLGQHPSFTAAYKAVSRQEGISAETLRRWAAEASINAEVQPRAALAEHEEIKNLKADNARLRRNVSALIATTALFAAELYPRHR